MPTNPPGYHRAYHRRKRLEAVAALGGCCEVCGWDDPRALEIDHRTRQHDLCPGGKKYRWAIIRRILAGDTADFQLLCCNHHAIKSHENGDFLARGVDNPEVAA